MSLMYSFVAGGELLGGMLIIQQRQNVCNKAIVINY